MKKKFFQSQIIKEFKINEFLVVKLENSTFKSGDFKSWYVEVNGKQIESLQCQSFALPNIPVKKIPNFSEIESIDKFTDQLGWNFNEYDEEFEPLSIDPEDNFWGLCSNLQAWYENNYDTTLLHSSLSFPILRALVDAGDSIAENMFKKEILQRFKSGYPPTIALILGEFSLDYISKEERIDIIEQTFILILNNIELLSLSFDTPTYSADSVFDFFIGEFWEWDDKRILKHFPHIWEGIERFSEQEKYDRIPEFINRFLPLIKSLQESETFFGDKFPFIIKLITKVQKDSLYILIDVIFKAITSGEFLEQYFDIIIDIIVDLIDDNIKSHLFSNLIRKCESLELLESKYSSFLDIITSFSSQHKYSEFPRFIEYIHSYNESIIDYFPNFFREFKTSLSQGDNIGKNFVSMAKSAKRLGLIDEYFLEFMDVLSKLPLAIKFRAFFGFVGLIPTSLEEKHSILIKAQFFALFLDLKILEETDPKFSWDVMSYYNKLLEIAKDWEYLYLPEVESEFLMLLEGINSISDGTRQYSGFIQLLEIGKKSKYFKKYYKLFLEKLQKLPDFDKIYQLSMKTIYEQMIKAVSGTDLESENAFQEWKIRAEKAQGTYAIKKEYGRVFLTLKIAKKVGRAKDRLTFESVMKYSHFLNDFHRLPDLNNLPEIDRQKIYSESISIVKDTFFENEPEFKKWNEKNKTSITLRVAKEPDSANNRLLSDLLKEAKKHFDHNGK